MTETPAKIISNKKAANDQHEMVLEIMGSLPAVKPGQFCLVSVNDPSRLLRRPFSVFRIYGKKRFSILYKIAGEGTKSLSECGPGTILSALLPLGNGFDIKGSSKDIVYLVGGGIGIASVFSLQHGSRKKTKFFYGARTAAELLPLKKDKRVEYFISTDDGSRGRKGFVTESVIEELKKDAVRNGGDRIHVMACGPNVMLKRLYSGIRRIDREVRLSFCFEERMACGMGVCMGCVVKTKDGYRRSCTDGPVMDADDIIW